MITTIQDSYSGGRVWRKAWCDVWRPSVCQSVCPVGMLIITHQRAAGDATIRTDILVKLLLSI